MATIGFIGLGIMGAPMAANLVTAGHAVRGYTLGAVPDGLGVTPVTSVRAACRGADIVVTMLPDTPDVLAVALGDDGVLAHLAPGTTYIDMSTIRPDGARAVHAAGAERGIRVLDAPVSGGQAGAVEGVLSIMVGGDRAVLADVLPVLESLGSTVVLVGGPGAGQTVKAANQLMVAGHLQMLAEAVVFLRAHDADLEAALTVLGGGLAGSTVLQRKRDNVLTGDFTPGFRIALHDKDLGIINEAARDKGVVLPATALITQLVRSLKVRGDGGLDHSALYKLTAELNDMGL